MQKTSKFLLSLWEVFEALAVALVSIFIIYNFIAQPFLVQGASMEPNFQTGNYLVVDEISYRFRDPARGEVVVFHNPANESEFYIKRVIGLPGEKVEIKGGVVKLDGKVLEEGYLPKDMYVDGDATFNLKTDEYFVMGDNRPRSYDSRRWGPLKKFEIIGAVRLRFWPLDSLEVY